MIPALDALGLLPPGVWNCTLIEAETAFCTNQHRRALWSGLQNFIAAEVDPLRPLPLWLDGSFTRLKDYPEDIDVVLDLTSMEEASALPIIVSLWSRRVEIKKAYHVDAWGKHPSFPNDLSAYFQYAGPKVAAELQISERQAKGILRVQL